MSEHADLELSLRPLGDGACALDMRFSRPADEADVRPAAALEPVRLDLEALRALALDPAAYGAALTAALFADPDARALYGRACAVAASLDLPLRLRLQVEPGPGLPPDIRWETLRDPEDGTPLALAERVLLSRYLAGDDWRPVRRRPRGALRALVAVANPADLADYAPGGRPLAPIDSDAELERARAALGDIPVTALAADGEATLERIVAALRDGYDILYLVCHGALAAGAPRLWLEDEHGLAQIVPGAELAARVRELPRPPMLVVLASCQSAGAAASADEGTLAALGPRLAEAGVPAVLAMQGNVALATMARFAPVFFAELRRDGQVDRAAAAARAAVADRDDWWAPALFMRLRDGCIWERDRPRPPLARRLALLAGGAVLLAGALASIAAGLGVIRPPGLPPAPTAGPPVMGGGLNIAVARLAYAGEEARPTTPEGDRLGESFAAGLAAGLELPGVEIQYLPASPWPEGQRPVAAPAQAEALSAALNADIVVYGALAYDPQARTTSLAPTFYLSPRKLTFDAGPQLIGHHPFGAPIVVAGEPVNSLTMERLRSQLGRRAEALVQVFAGLDAFFLGEYDRALAAFAGAEQSGALGDDSGRALVYLLQATAAGRRADPQALDDAERLYGEMLAVAERVGDGSAAARARLGLAAVAFARAGGCEPAQASDVERAIGLYQEAALVSLPAGAPRADLDVWSRFGRGRGHFCLAVAFRDDPERADAELRRAEGLLAEAVAAYQAADPAAQARLRYYAGEAYIVLGGVHLRRAGIAGEGPAAAPYLAQAREGFERAVATSADPARRAYASLQLAHTALRQGDCPAADAALAAAAELAAIAREEDALTRDWAFVDQRRPQVEQQRAGAACSP